MLCALILFSGTYSLKSILNDKFFLRTFLWQILFILRVFAIILLREQIAVEIFFFSRPLRLISQYTTY